MRCAPPEVAPPVASQTIRDGFHAKAVEDALATGVRTIRLTSDFGETTLLDGAIVTGSRGEDTFTVRPDDPFTAWLVSRYAGSMRSGPAYVSSVARSELAADETHRHLVWEVTVQEPGQEPGRAVFRRARTARIAKDRR